MGAPTPICIYDDLPVSKTRITLGAANNELAGWVDVEVRIVAKERQGGLAILQDDLLQGLLDHLFNNQFVHLLHAWGGGIGTSVAGNLFAASCLQRLGVLRRDHDRVNFPRLNGTIRALQ